MFETEPPTDWSLAKLPQVIATPHIAASTEEAQELVGLETAATVRDFLRDGMVRNAVNFPSMPPDELQRLQPWIRLADRARRDRRRRWARRASRRIGVRYYGALAESRERRRAGRERRRRRAAADSVERRLDRERARRRARRAASTSSSRAARGRAHFTSLLSIKLQTERRRALGGGHRVRAEQPAAGVGARRQRRSAARPARC